MFVFGSCLTHEPPAPSKALKTTCWASRAYLSAEVGCLMSCPTDAIFHSPYDCGTTHQLFCWHISVGTGFLAVLLGFQRWSILPILGEISAYRGGLHRWNKTKKKGRPKATHWVVIDCHGSHTQTDVGKRIWLGVDIFLCGFEAAVAQSLSYGDCWHRQLIGHP